LILAGLVVLLTARSLGAIYVYAIILGLGIGATVTIETAIIGTYYGRTNFTRILGIIVPATLIFEAAGPIVAGSIYVATGKYTVSFIIVAVFALIGIIFAFFARPPKLPSLKKL
jgi:MFS family permease